MRTDLLALGLLPAWAPPAPGLDAPGHAIVRRGDSLTDRRRKAA